MIVLYWGGVNLNAIKKRGEENWKRMLKSLITKKQKERRSWKRMMIEERGPVTFGERG